MVSIDIYPTFCIIIVAFLTFHEVHGDKCGQLGKDKTVEDYIFEAQPFPWTVQVHLKKSRRPITLGALIEHPAYDKNDNHTSIVAVLSYAIKVIESTAYKHNLFTIYAGHNARKSKKYRPFDIKVKANPIGNGLEESEFQGVGFLKLIKPIPIASNLVPACLPKDKISDSKQCFVSGKQILEDEKFQEHAISIEPVDVLEGSVNKDVIFGFEQRKNGLMRSGAPITCFDDSIAYVYGLATGVGGKLAVVKTAPMGRKKYVEDTLQIIKQMPTKSFLEKQN